MKTTLLFLLTLVSGAFAHDLWLEAIPAAAAPEEPIGISLMQGHGFDQAVELPRSESHLDKFRVWYPNGSSEEIVGLQNETPVGVTNFPEPGSYLLAYQSKPLHVKLDGLTFEKHLLREGYEDLIRDRHRNGEASAPAEETYIRCAKTVVRIGEGGAAAAKVAGLPLEIVADGHGASEISVQLLYEGKPVSNLLVFAKRRGTETEKAVRTDGEGRAAFSISEAGFWILRCVMIQPPRSQGQKWHSYWASYSFSK